MQASKKIITIFTLLLTLSLIVSCTKDTYKRPPISTLLIGNWRANDSDTTYSFSTDNIMSVNDTILGNYFPDDNNYSADWYLEDNTDGTLIVRQIVSNNNTIIVTGLPYKPEKTYLFKIK